MPFALALQKTGGVDLVVQGLMDVAGSKGPYLMLGCLFVMCAAIGLFISNTATAVLMAPIALAAAKSMGVSPYPFCDGGRHGGLGGVYDPGIVAGEHPGAGAGEIFIQRFCQNRRAVHTPGDGGVRPADPGAVSVLIQRRPSPVRLTLAGEVWGYKGESWLISSRERWKLGTNTCIK